MMMAAASSEANITSMMLHSQTCTHCTACGCPPKDTQKEWSFLPTTSSQPVLRPLKTARSLIGTVTSFICCDRKMEYSRNCVPLRNDSFLVLSTIIHSTTRRASEPAMAKTGEKE